MNWNADFDADEVVQRAGRVGVLMGGLSAERDVSLVSGNAILGALVRAGVDAHPIDWDVDFHIAALATQCDRVFIALHGRGGEDGYIQGALDVMGMPYTGSSVLGCALSMDKFRSKQLWRGAGLPTPPFVTIAGTYDAAAVIEELGLPLAVKPIAEGSSFGVSKVTGAEQLVQAVREAGQFDSTVLVEKWIVGGEYTLGVLCDRPLPLIKIDTPHEFYDFEAKYVVDTTRYHCPCGLSDAEEQAAAAMGLAAYSVLGAGGWGRVDFMRDEQRQFWLIEFNSVPGMTDHSLVPMAAAQAGLYFDRLVLAILSTSFDPGQGR